MSKPTNSQTIIIGNSSDIYINPCECNSEIRTDVVVSQFNAIRLWGQILNCHGQPVPNALVKLVKIISNGTCVDYEGVAHTTSDCNGFYQFDICSNEQCWYKILVGKATTGKEIIVDSASPYPSSNNDYNDASLCTEY